jgi:hypothetical protein
MLHGFVQICLALANITCDGRVGYSFTTQWSSTRTACSRNQKRTCSTGVHLETFLETVTFLTQRKHWFVQGEGPVSSSTTSAAASAPLLESGSRRAGLVQVNGRRLALPVCLQELLKPLLGNCDIPSSGRASADAVSTVDDRNTESLAITYPSRRANMHISHTCRKSCLQGAMKRTVAVFIMFIAVASLDSGSACPAPWSRQS